MLLDERQFGRDFNGNGVADLELEYARRTRRFSSSEPYDVANKGRRDARNKFGSTLRFNITSGLRLRATALHTAQTLNRANAVTATGDVADYSRLRTSLGLEYHF